MDLETLREFWSSDKLTGSQTELVVVVVVVTFWSSDKLTGSQTAGGGRGVAARVLEQ